MLYLSLPLHSSPGPTHMESNCWTWVFAVEEIKNHSNFMLFFNLGSLKNWIRRKVKLEGGGKWSGPYLLGGWIVLSALTSLYGHFCSGLTCVPSFMLQCPVVLCCFLPCSKLFLLPKSHLFLLPDSYPRLQSQPASVSIPIPPSNVNCCLLILFIPLLLSSLSCVLSFQVWLIISYQSSSFLLL